MLLVVAYSFIMGMVIFKIVNLIYPIRVSEDEEEIGLDLSQHGEEYQPREETFLTVEPRTFEYV
jgi:Amt family ammonium transporter